MPLFSLFYPEIMNRLWAERAASESRCAKKVGESDTAILAQKQLQRREAYDVLENAKFSVELKKNRAAAKENTEDALLARIKQLEDEAAWNRRLLTASQKYTQQPHKERNITIQQPELIFAKPSTTAASITTGVRVYSPMSKMGPRECERTVYLRANDMISGKMIKKVEVVLHGDDASAATVWAAYPNNPVKWFRVEEESFCKTKYEDPTHEEEAGTVPLLTARGGVRYTRASPALPRHHPGETVLSAESRGTAPWTAGNAGDVSYIIRLDDTHGGLIVVKWKVAFYESEGWFEHKESFTRRSDERTHNVTLPIPGTQKTQLNTYDNWNELVHVPRLGKVKPPSRFDLKEEEEEEE